LRDLARLTEIMQSIKDAWREGNNAKLEKVSLVPFRKDFPQIYEHLIAKRNTSWIPKIEALLKTDEVEMILVGAMHLVGTNGILEQLKADGYQVQMLE